MIGKSGTAAKRISRVADGDPIDDNSTTKVGPLTGIAANAEKLDASLASSAVVFGTDKGRPHGPLNSSHIARTMEVSVLRRGR